MDMKECISFANQNPVGHVATMDDDQPRVRAFLMWYADESGFYFHTAETKKVCRQLGKNPKVEVCFCSSPNFEQMMRVTGTVEFLTDSAMRARLMEERSFLKAIVKGPDDPLLVIFRIPHGEATFWTMADNLKEDQMPRVTF